MCKKKFKNIWRKQVGITPKWPVFKALFENDRDIAPKPLKWRFKSDFTDQFFRIFFKTHFKKNEKTYQKHWFFHIFWRRFWAKILKQNWSVKSFLNRHFKGFGAISRSFSNRALKTVHFGVGEVRNVRRMTVLRRFWCLSQFSTVGGSIFCQKSNFSFKNILKHV